MKDIWFGRSLVVADGCGDGKFDATMEGAEEEEGATGRGTAFVALAAAAGDTSAAEAGAAFLALASTFFAAFFPALAGKGDKITTK